ncbi:hypothetical protein EAH80_02080 [Mycobacterium hodleri]|uniref:Amidohydrolase-related domain-containing protein n=1 Tax=Mycolicibacterium hodleri TaxID=49897 RepID=A0A502EHX5_9MYCO|nr:hypothetical protein EAH80_02080 [Mycolicibacterium hodleri]
MATAKEARDWARHGLRGIGDSLYTPFCGTDGDDIDWEAYRTFVRHCVGALSHEMLWCTSGLAEFWALTLDERKRLLEVAITEARAVNPHVVIQSCTSATAAKDWPHGEGLADPITFTADIPQFPEFSAGDTRKVMRDNALHLLADHYRPRLTPHLPAGVAASV